MWFYFLVTSYGRCGDRGGSLRPGPGLMDKNDPGPRRLAGHAGPRPRLCPRARAAGISLVLRRPTLRPAAMWRTASCSFDFHGLFPCASPRSRISRTRGRPQSRLRGFHFHQKQRRHHAERVGLRATFLSWSSSTTSAGAIRASQARRHSSGAGTKSPGSRLTPEKERNDWLRYAWKWVRDTDPNGHLQMARQPRDEPRNARWAALVLGQYPQRRVAPDGFNTEETIRELWGGLRAPKWTLARGRCCR